MKSIKEEVMKWVEKEYGVMTADNIAEAIIEKTMELVGKRLWEEIEKERKEVREAFFAFLRTKTSERIIGRTEGIIDGLDRAEELIKKVFGVVEG